MRSSHSTCEEIQTDALAHLSGETSALEKQRFEAHLERCKHCRNRVEGISSMMEAARGQPFLPSPVVRDKMFESVLRDIEETGQRPATQPITFWRRSAPRPAAYALIAAGVAAVATTAIFTWHGDDPILPDTASAVAVQSPVAPPTSHVDSLETMRASDNLILGVSKGARYSVDMSRESYRLNLKRGRVWIRFIHSSKERGLTVSGPELTVEVVGTVLVVEVDEGDAATVGVLEGKVKVTPKRGDTILLSAGDVRKPTGRVVSMADGLKEQAAVWQAELMGEGDALVERADAKEGADVEGETVSPKCEEGTVPGCTQAHTKKLTDMYAVAEGHMQKGAFKAAAKTLERLIKEAPRSTRADTARLELARIYAKRLDQPDKASHHLEAYLKRHPSGQRSTLVRKQLCRLSENNEIDVQVRCHDRSSK